MPPIDTTPPSVVRYLTRLLAALALQAGGELRVPLKFVREVNDETGRQALIEDTNTDSDELVLRFGSKHSAVYPVEPEPCASIKSVISPPSSQPLKSDISPTVRPPLTELQLLNIERTAKAKRVQSVLKREQQQRDSSSQSEVNFPV